MNYVRRWQEAQNLDGNLLGQEAYEILILPHLERRNGKRMDSFLSRGQDAYHYVCEHEVLLPWIKMSDETVEKCVAFGV